MNNVEENSIDGTVKHTKAAWKGVQAGLDDLASMIIHPIDNLIIPVAELSYDALATLYVAQTQSSYGVTPHHWSYLPDAVCDNPAEVVFAESLERMNLRKEVIQSAYTKFQQGDSETRTEMLAHATVSFIGPGVVLKNAAKVVYNVDKFGQITTPPVFKSRVTPTTPPVGLNEVTKEMIRNTPGKTTYTSIALEDGRLIFVPSEIKTNLFDKAGNPITIRVKHSDLHKLNPKGYGVIWAGESTFEGGELIDILSKSGRYTPDGHHLKLLAEHVFFKNGFHALGKYTPLPELAKVTATTNRVSKPTFTLFAPTETLLMQPVAVAHGLNAEDVQQVNPYDSFASLLDGFSQQTNAWTTAGRGAFQFYNNADGVNFQQIINEGFRLDGHTVFAEDASEVAAGPRLNEVNIDAVPKYIEKLFEDTDSVDVDVFLKRFDDKARVALQQDGSDLSKALLTELQIIEKYQQYDTQSIEKLSSSEEKMQFVRMSQEAVNAFGHMSAFARNHLHSQWIGTALNLASGFASMGIAYTLGMTWAGVGAFFAGANMLMSALSRSPKGDNGMLAAFQALDSKMDMILQQGFKIYEFLQSMSQYIAENFFNVLNGLEVLHKGQKDIYEQGLYQFGYVRGGNDFIIDSEQQHILRESASYGDTVPFDDLREDDYFRLSKGAFNIAADAYAGFLNGEIISQLERKSDSKPALGDLSTLVSTGKANGYFLAEFNAMGWIQETSRFFNPIIRHAAAQAYMSLGPMYPKQVQELITQNQEFLALKKILRLHLPRQQTDQFSKIYDVLETMSHMYDHTQKTRDVVNYFPHFEARHSHLEFNTREFKSEQIVLDGIHIRDNGRLERVPYRCIHNHEFYGLVYFSLAKFTFSNFIVPREKTNGKSFYNCPKIYVTFWDGSTHDVTKYPQSFNYNRHGHLWDWDAHPNHAEDGVRKANDKYKALRRDAVKSQLDDLRVKIPEWFKGLQVAFTKLYQSCLTAGDVHPSFCQTIPEFPFAKYNQDELLKPLIDDLNQDRGYRDALPINKNFLEDLEKYVKKLKSAENEISKHRSQYLFQNLPEMPDRYTFEFPKGFSGCFFQIHGDSTKLYFLQKSTRSITDLAIVSEKQDDFARLIETRRFKLSYLVTYDVKQLLAYISQSSQVELQHNENSHDPVEYYIKKQTAQLQEIHHELTTNPKPRTFARSVDVNEVRRTIDTQQKLLDDGFKALNSAINNLSKLNQQTYQKQLALWTKLFENFVKNRNLLFDKAFTFENDNSSVHNEATAELIPLAKGSELQRLCANSQVELLQIQNLLEALFEEDPQSLDSMLNPTGPIEHRPLYLAMQTQRVDIVSLLLSYDTTVQEQDIEYLESLPADKANQEILARLDFHRYLQKYDLHEKMMPGRTISLVSSGIEQLKVYEGQPKDAVVFYGRSKVGKSTLANVYWGGTVYEEVDGELQLKSGSEEYTSTSDGISSETIYPTFLEGEQFIGVDMPGFCESRGIAFETAAGITVQYFNKLFTNAKLMVLVITPHDIFEDGGKPLVEVLNNYASIIGQSTERMENVLLLINKKNYGASKSVEDVIARLQKISASRDLTKNAKFLLQNLQAKHILISSPVDAEFKQKLTDTIQRTQSTPIANFNLASFHRNVAGFRELMGRIEQYIHDRQHDKESVLASIAVEQLKQLQLIKKALDDLEFSPEIKFTSQVVERDEFNKKMQAQRQLKSQLLEQLVTPVMDRIVTDYSAEEIDTVGTFQTAEKYGLATKIADDFMQQIYAVGLTQTDTLEEDSYNSYTTKTFGSFGIPGAGAVEIDMRGYVQDADGFWEYLPPKVVELPLGKPEYIEDEHAQTTNLQHLNHPDVPFSHQVALMQVAWHTLRKWVGWTTQEESSHPISDEENQALDSLYKQTKTLLKRHSTKVQGRELLSQHKCDNLDDAGYLLHKTKCTLQKALRTQMMSEKTIQTIEEDLERVHNWLEHIPCYGINMVGNSTTWSPSLWSEPQLAQNLNQEKLHQETETSLPVELDNLALGGGLLPK